MRESWVGGAWSKIRSDLRRVERHVEAAAAALEHCVSRAIDDWGISVRATYDVARTYSAELTLLAFRVLGEALHNAAKHAQATEVVVVATEDDEGLRLHVSDDGRGTPRHVVIDGAPDRAFGTGFNLLVQQVRDSGGRLEVESGPGLGTTVRCRLPIPTAQSPDDAE